jgi:hypothetical protein
MNETGTKIEEEPVDRDEVAGWFENATDARRRYQDPPPEAGELLAKLVRRPGDPSRNSATSLSKREPQPPQDQRRAGEGEWHGAIHRIDEEKDNRRDPAYEEREDRNGAFAEALREAEVDPDFHRSVMFQGVVDAHAMLVTGTGGISHGTDQATGTRHSPRSRSSVTVRSDSLMI